MLPVRTITSWSRETVRGHPTVVRVGLVGLLSLPECGGDLSPVPSTPTLTSVELGPACIPLIHCGP